MDKVWVGAAMAFVAALLFYYRYYPSAPEGVQVPIRIRGFLMFTKVFGDLIKVAAFFKQKEPTMYMAEVAASLKMTSPIEEGVEVSSAAFDGVDVRIYTPDDQTPKGPGLVFYHGGGWLFGSADMTSQTTSSLAKALNAVVVSVNYRMAPKHPFPVPFEDCLTATKYFLKHAADYGVDPTRITVAGDSAGGNLAAAVSLRLRDTKENLPQLKAQILFYPAVQALSTDGPSVQADQDLVLKKSEMVKFWLYYARGHIKNHASMLSNNHTSATFKASMLNKYLRFDTLPNDFFHKDYIPSKNNHGDTNVWAELREVFLNPDFAPLVADDLGGLPTAYVYTAHCDILRDEGVLYAQKLEEAGVKVKHYHSKTGFHGVLSFGASDESRNILSDVAEFFRDVDV